jgi:hypothetical protein
VTIQEILAFVRALPPRERLRVIEQIVHEVAEAESAASPAPAAVWGDASDEEFETFLAAVASARTTDTLRDSDGPSAR